MDALEAGLAARTIELNRYVKAQFIESAAPPDAPRRVRVAQRVRRQQYMDSEAFRRGLYLSLVSQLREETRTKHEAVYNAIGSVRLHSADSESLIVSIDADVQ